MPEPRTTWFGVDETQWRALVVAYLRMDFRAAGSAVPQQAEGRRTTIPMLGILMVMGVGSAAFAALARAMSDVQMSAALLMTYGALNTMMMLLVEFTGVVVSPHDYGILGHRPVSSRTYFAARLASVAVYVSAMSVTLAILPALAYAFWRDLGLLVLPVTVAAVVLCNLSATVVVIAGYVFLLGLVHPKRLSRATGYLQLATAMAFYAVYYLASQAFRRSFLDQLDFSAAPWLWVNPAAWFAALVPVSAGIGTPAHWSAAGAAMLLFACCIPLAAGRLSLDYARRLGEVSAVAEPPRRRRRESLIPGFRRDERRAVALLIGAQFRYDQRFRLAVLSVLPLTAFYLLLGMDQGALADPFEGEFWRGGVPVWFAAVFLPMTLHAALTVSQSWRAAWIFFATPASPARIVVATKNFVTVYLMGGYLLGLAAIWSWSYGNVWHAVVNAFFIGLFAHLLLQLVVIVKPTLPFAAQPRRAERSAALMATFFVAAMVAGMVPLVLPAIYAQLRMTAVVLCFLVIVTAVMEYALRLRVAEAMSDLEFRA